MKEANGIRNALIYLVLASSFILIVKAAQIQIVDKKYREQAKRATLDKNILYPSRGLIYDRYGELLVSNRPIYDIEAIYRNVTNIDTNKFCELLQIDKQTFINKLEKDWSRPQYHKSVPYLFLTKVPPSEFLKFQEHLYQFPGFYPKRKTVRSYPHSNGANILGYLGEVDQSIINRSEGEYKAGEFIGVSGLERRFEQLLKGKKGLSYVLKDNLGREVGAYDGGRLDSTATPGVDLMTSIDLKLQTYGEELMQNKRGAIVAIEPSTGEILTMVSAPSFDPNLISLNKNRSQAFDSLMQDTINKPFLDRAAMASYPPGSIFKPVLSLIAMQQGILDPNRTIYCDGVYELDSRGKSVQRCHAHPTPYNVSIALEHSCNSYYYQIMREFVNQYGYTEPGRGLDTLVDRLYKFGLGRQLDADLVNEQSGFIPTSKFYDNAYRSVVNGWRSTYILSVGIGQGELQVSTLQMANLAAIIANRGYFITPHIVKGFGNNQPIDEKYRVKRSVEIDEIHFEPVIDGMEQAVMRGTAVAGYVPGLSICGKTGTSENPFGKDHSVFFGFAPKDNPKIAIAVYVENAGWGGEIATPIASLVMEKYLTDTIADRRKYLEQRMIEKDLINVQ